MKFNSIILERFSRQISWQSVQNVCTKPLAIKKYTLKEVAAHCTVESCWMVINDKVYDLTNFIGLHAGGTELMLEYAGTDATNAFMEKPHTIEASDMLREYLIGELVEVIFF
jgi:cytochrome b5